ncbi:MAG: hypothetical protein HKP52_03360 [Desulfofustis sp.]|nr:hypothetical protein [Desulfofustis sp.]NNK13253.1 hypothetical protein [Desulfofustis sp.]
MAEIKALSQEAIPEALQMAERYRLLNEPDEAESICLDILAADPNHQEALITLLLSQTDKFRDNRLIPAFDQAKEIVDKLGDAYCKSYYLGVIFERRAKYHLKLGGPGAGTVAHGWLVKAMDEYKDALTNCDPGNQKAVLRLNSCVRLMNNNPEIQPDSSEQREPLLDSFDTPH